jgi:hypothetical protein
VGAIDHAAADSLVRGASSVDLVGPDTQAGPYAARPEADTDRDDRMGGRAPVRTQILEEVGRTLDEEVAVRAV